MRISLLVTILAAACGGGAVAPQVIPLETQKYAPALNVDLSSSTRTANGVYFRDTIQGAGSRAAAGNGLHVNYAGFLADGSRFDAGPFLFHLGQHEVIAGWDEGLAGVQAGATRQLVIPAALAYGAGGSGPIPPNANLVFNVIINSFEAPVPIERDVFSPKLMVNLAASTKTINGVYVQDTVAGSGAAAVSGQMLTVENINGYLTDGIRFDFTQGPVAFKLGSGTALPGLDEGLMGAQVGATRKIVIPSPLAYSFRGRGSVLPYANVVYDVTVRGIAP